MSERYGKCEVCGGRGERRCLILLRTTDCGRCGGTGISGDVRGYLQSLADREWEETIYE